MKRAIIATASAIVFGLAGYGVHWRLQLEPRLLAAIEEVGSEMTGCRVEVASVSLALIAGRGRIDGLTIANPDGFSERAVFRLGEIALQLEVESLWSGPLVIDQVIIRDAEVFFEMDAERRSNVQVIADNLLLYDSRIASNDQAKMMAPPGDDEAEPGAGPYGSKPFQGTVAARNSETDKTDEADDWRPTKIRDFVFEDARLIVDVRAFGGFEGEYDLPPLYLENLGGEAGRSPPQIGMHVLASYSGTVLKAVAAHQIDQLFEADSGGGIRERARKLLQSLFD